MMTPSFFFSVRLSTVRLTLLISTTQSCSQPTLLHTGLAHHYRRARTHTHSQNLSSSIYAMNWMTKWQLVWNCCLQNSNLLTTVIPKPNRHVCKWFLPILLVLVPAHLFLQAILIIFANGNWYHHLFDNDLGFFMITRRFSGLKKC